MLEELGPRQQQVLKLILDHKPGLTVAQLVNRLGITRTAVHQHLTALERDGYIEKTALTQTGGRPGHVYTLTERGLHLFPKQYAWFSDLLLTRLKDELGAEGLVTFLQSLGTDVAQQFKDSIAGKPPAEQIERVAQIMQNLGYEATTLREQDPALPSIRAHNCVYHQLAKAHREVCELDLALLRTLLGREINHLECMVRGGHACRFQVGALINADAS